MKSNMMMNLLFGVGLIGLYLNRSHIMIMLISLEIIFLSMNLNLLYYTMILDSGLGFVYVLCVLTVAAAEAAMGLSLVVLFYRVRGGISVDLVALLKG